MKKFAFYTAFFLLASSVFAQNNITFTEIQWREDMLLSKEPIVTGFEGTYAIVEFETLIDAPPSVAYYGVPHTEGNLTTPRYRKSAKGTHIDNKRHTTKLKWIYPNLKMYITTRD